MLPLGIVLMVAGAALLVVEAHVVSYGVLGLLGTAMLALGSGLALQAAGAPGLVALAVAALVATAALAAAVLLLRTAARASRRRIQTGREALVGRVGEVRSAPAPKGQVLVDGALWQARPAWGAEDDEPLKPGEAVVVEEISGLTLGVRRAEDWEVHP
jgi:membrane-bound ClpP family serine protease